MITRVESKWTCEMFVIFESGCDGGGKRMVPVNTGWHCFEHDEGQGTLNRRLLCVLSHTQHCF